MNIRFFHVKIEGRSLLMHNGQLVDPLNEFSKRLKEQTKKRKKSDADHMLIAEIEFQGGLYFDPVHGPYIPGTVIDACLKAGATRSRLGKVFESCISTTGDIYPLIYDGPRTREGLWADPRFRDRRAAGVQKARVMRTRPKFNGWSLEFDVHLLPCDANPEDLKRAIVDAGIYSGLCDYRPRFGSFNLVSFDEVEKPLVLAA
jgi:hypothetical protein